MSVDKAVDSIQLDGAMTATADAIREKRGFGGAIQWDAETGFADKISDMTWEKPDNWPDIEALPINSNSRMCIYMLFDCTADVRYASLRTNSVYTVYSYARWENGSLGDWTTFSNTLALPSDCEFIIVKAENTSYDSFIVFNISDSLGLYSTSNNAGSNQPCVWMYGQLNPQSALSVYLNQTGGFSTLMLKRAKIIINSNVSFASYGWLICPNLVSLIIKGVSDERFSLKNVFIINAPHADVTIGKCEISAFPGIESCRSLTFEDAISSELTINAWPDLHLESLTIHGNIPVSNMSTLCRYNAQARSVDVSGFDLSACSEWMRFFSKSAGITSLIFGNGLAISISISDYSFLTHDSLVDFLTKLGSVDTVKTITLGKINMAKLTEDEIAIATEKGWTVA